MARKVATTAEARVSLRLTQEIVTRAERLRPKMQRDPEFATFGKVKQSTVLKEALLRGLGALEAEYK